MDLIHRIVQNIYYVIELSDKNFLFYDKVRLYSNIYNGWGSIHLFRIP